MDIHNPVWTSAQCGPAPEPDRYGVSAKEREALEQLFTAQQTLMRLGWRSAPFPHDGSYFWSIGPGSTGVFDTTVYSSGHPFVMDGGDAWPAEVILWRPMAKKKIRKGL